MKINYNGIVIILVRTINPNINYLYYADEKISEYINLEEYKLNSIFTNI
ncbi:TPA: hypothetical protein KNI16_003315 [Clostridioides difficile]|nr:hypothetical protein [Clostridioides difficile]